MTDYIVFEARENESRPGTSYRPVYLCDAADATAAKETARDFGAIRYIDARAYAEPASDCSQSERDTAAAMTRAANAKNAGRNP